jgi:hypothetical protein
MIKMLKPFLRLVSQSLRRATALMLALLLLQAPELFAQAASVVAAAQAGAPQALHIVILDGENALNNIRQRSAREPIVQIEDENHKPVAGAVVLFAIHSGAGGAGGSFAGASTVSAVTGLDGQAVAKGLKPNGVQGQFTITVQATVGTVATSAVITQTNIIGAPGAAQAQAKPGTTSTTATHLGVHIFSKNFWIVAGSVGAATAAVVTVAVVTHSNGATITPGTGTIKP